jgi:ferredoxin
VAIISIILAENKYQEVSYQSGPSLLEVLPAASVYLPAVCGENGSCGKCTVRVRAGFLPVTASNRERFSKGQLRKVTAFPTGNAGVEVSETGERDFSAINSFEGEDESPSGLDEELLSLDKLRLAPGRKLSYTELLEVSKLTDTQGRFFEAAATAEPEKLRLYRDRAYPKSPATHGFPDREQRPRRRREIPP